MTGFVWEEYRNTLLRQAYRLVHNVSDAQDLVQDTFLRAYVRQDQQRDRASALPWLRSILFSVFCNRFAKDKRRGEGNLSLDLIPEKSMQWESQRIEDSPERVLLNADLGHALQVAVTMLPPDYRECLLLCDAEGLRYNTIADQLGVTLPVVKSRLHRARRRVRAALIAQGYGV